MEKKFYVIFEQLITEDVVERLCFLNPSAHSDGTYEDLSNKIGEFDSVCAFNSDSTKEAEDYINRMYPTIIDKDTFRITYVKRH